MSLSSVAIFIYLSLIKRFSLILQVHPKVILPLLLQTYRPFPRGLGMSRVADFLVNLFAAF